MNTANADWGNFFYKVIKLLVDLPQKLYTMLTYKIDISLLQKVVKLFNSDLNVPSTLSLMEILGSLGGVILAFVLIYHLFK